MARKTKRSPKSPRKSGKGVTKGAGRVLAPTASAGKAAPGPRVGGPTAPQP